MLVWTCLDQQLASEIINPVFYALYAHNFVLGKIVKIFRPLMTILSFTKAYPESFMKFYSVVSEEFAVYTHTDIAQIYNRIKEQVYIQHIVYLYFEYNIITI